MEREVYKHGEAIVESFAMANAPLFLKFPSESARAGLQFNLLAVAKNPDVNNAQLADSSGVVVASLNRHEIGQKLPSYLTHPEAQTVYTDRANHAYFFRASVRYGQDVLGTFVVSLSSRPVELALDRARRRAILLALAISTAVYLFALFFIRREVRPLQVMSHALDSIAKGDFSQRVPKGRNDEIGELSNAFNAMLKRADLFFHYVDKMIIERLIGDESLTRPGGRLRELSVIFGDMRGYTSMSNRRNANDVVRIVNTYFHLLIECIAYWGGVVDKTMGDAIMAVFERSDGESEDHHKRNAVLCVAYMKAATRVLNAFVRNRMELGQDLDLEPREFGFAMATGRAIVGNIGSKRRMNYTVCGRLVNLASRLEGQTKSGEVIIDNFTRIGTEKMIVYETLPPVQPKGFSENEKVVPHRITALSDEESQRLRVFLKKLFGYSFVHDFLMPKALPVGEQQPWCQEAEVQIIRIVAETPTTEFFIRVDTETGRPVSAQPMAKETSNPPPLTERRLSQRVFEDT